MPTDQHQRENAAINVRGTSPVSFSLALFLILHSCVCVCVRLCDRWRRRRHTNEIRARSRAYYSDGSWQYGWRMHGADTLLPILFLRSRCLASTFTFSASLHTPYFLLVFSLRTHLARIVGFLNFHRVFIVIVLSLEETLIMRRDTLSFGAFLNFICRAPQSMQECRPYVTKMVKSIGNFARSKYPTSVRLNRGSRRNKCIAIILTKQTAKDAESKIRSNKLY